jgi:hypothetical protein
VCNGREVECRNRTATGGDGVPLIMRIDHALLHYDAERKDTCGALLLKPSSD